MNHTSLGQKSYRAIAAVLFTLTAMASSEGAIIVWDNGAGTLNWGAAANWNPNGVPAANNQIQFNGIGPGSAQVTSGATVTMAGVAAYGANPTTTEVDLNNGAGFTIDIGASNNFTYFPTIKVQDAFDYTLLSGSAGRLAITGTTTVDVVSGGSLTVDGGFTVSGYGTGNMIKTGDGTMFLTGGRPANASTVTMNVQGGILSTNSVNNLGTGYLAAQFGGTFQYTGAGAETKTGFLYWNNGTATFDITQSTANLTFNITGGTRDQPFTKTGPGTLTLQGGAANGPVTLSGGTLVYRNAVGTNPSSIPLNGAFEIHSNTADLTPSGFTIPTNNGIVRFRADAGRIIRLQSTMNIDGGKIQIVGAGTTRNDALTADWTSNTASLEVLSGATFDIRGNNTVVNALDGTGAIINSYYRATSGIIGHTLTVGVANGSGEFGGTISGAGTTNNLPGEIDLVKTGSGVQILGGNNSYAGTTSVNNGTLVVNGTHTGGAQYTVAGGATLGGNGTITAPVNLSGRVAPGNSVGMLTTGSETWNNGSIFHFEINDASGSAGVNPGWDLLTIHNVTNSASLNLSGVSPGGITVDVDSLAGSVAGLAANFDATLSYDWLFVDADVAISSFASNLFAVDATGFMNNIAASAQDGMFSVVRGDSVLGGDDTQLYLHYQAAIVPEPSTGLMFLIGSLAVGLFAWRQRGQQRR